jgi:hypothetical protein
MGIVVSKQAAEKTTIVFDVGIYGCGEVVGVDPVTIRLVLLPISWVVDKKSIWRRGAPNNNAVHCMGLVLGSLLVAVLFMVEIAEGEKGNPCSFIMTNTMNKEKRMMQGDQRLSLV